MRNQVKKMMISALCLGFAACAGVAGASLANGVIDASAATVEQVDFIANGAGVKLYGEGTNTKENGIRFQKRRSAGGINAER